jgi:hypothetical protein
VRKDNEKIAKVDSLGEEKMRMSGINISVNRV